MRERGDLSYEHQRPLRAALDWIADRDVGIYLGEAAMTDEELRQACEDIVESIGAEASDSVPILLRFAKQQQAVAYQDIDARIGVGGHRIEYMRSSNWEIEFRELADYVHAKAKESHDEKHT